MDPKKEAVRHIRENGASSGTEIARRLGISRQALNRHIKALVEEGVLYKQGTTKGARYHLVGSGPGVDTDIVRPQTYERTLPIENLSEDEVFREVDIVLNLSSHLSDNAYEIVRYAFTELLNNAIDHSDSETCRIGIQLSPYTIAFSIRDFGVGIFARLQEYYKLRDEYDALAELLKGKRTVAPERHSGEGLFFTSRIGDTVEIRSHAITIAFLNAENDLATGEIPWKKGTNVSFTVSKRTKKRLQDVFDRYAPEEYDYTFARSEVRVQLFQREYVSRSEGRRLVSGLDTFRSVILDFKDVTVIRQGFADEVFRVFPQRNGDVQLEVKNASLPIIKMIRHVGGSKYVDK